MNLRDLHYFVVLAEVKHFGEAAKRCFVSQPTLSMQIKKLEDSLGVVLFERTNKQVLLTDQGTALLSRVKNILTLVNEVKELARLSQDPFSGELRLGVIPTVAPYLLPIVMPIIQNSFPKLKIWLIEAQTHQLISQLEGGEIDAAIMAQPIHGDFAHQNLYSELFYFACSSSHPFANYNTIDVGALADQPILLLEEGHCLREQAMAVCQLAQASELADFSATSLETLRLMVQAGMGVTLLPVLSALAYQSELLKCIPFTAPAPSRTVALFWRKSTPKQLCLQALSETISQATDGIFKMVGGS